MKTASTLLLIPIVMTMGMITASADTFLSEGSRHFLDDTHYWDDQMFGDRRVNFSMDAIASSRDYDQLPNGIHRGDSLQDPRYFLDDTHYWDDQMFGNSRTASRVNFSISPADSKSYAEAIDTDVFLEY